MKMSSRAKRMQRHHTRGRRRAALNLVSLMDIFTILVFFLLVNSSDVQDLPSAKSIQMPESVAEAKPRQNVVIMVTAEDILVQGRPVATIAEVMGSKKAVIEPLQQALLQQTARMVRQQSDEDIPDREVTIMGDKEIPYRLLKKVMATCTQADYGRISLAVVQKTVEQPA